jgi:protoheme IX farnesyltransferase
VDNRIVSRFIRRIGFYLALMKPRVIELLLVTTAPVMVLAAGGFPDLGLLLGTLVGGALSAGSANAFNMYIDRDIDVMMARTKGRPIVTGDISATKALVFAVTIGIASLAILSLVANLLAALLALAAILFYVFVYTLGLKRRTEQNIVWGGIAGCFPVLIGWAAVTGELSLTPWILFVVVFLK